MNCSITSLFTFVLFGCSLSTGMYGIFGQEVEEVGRGDQGVDVSSVSVRFFTTGEFNIV